MTTTQFGFTFGPMEIERAIGDPDMGYVVVVKIGECWIDIATSPAGRSIYVTERTVKDNRVVETRELRAGLRRKPRADGSETLHEGND